MGLASSQARLLNLTTRMHQIEYKAAKLEAEKLQMANKSRQVYQDYMNTLEQTKIQHKFLNSDGSATFRDVSYFDIMFGRFSPNSNDDLFNSAVYGSEITDTKNTAVNWQYGLFSTQNGFMYVPKDIKEAYENSSSAQDFAEQLSNWTPTSNSTGLYYNENNINPNVTKTVNPYTEIEYELEETDAQFKIGRKTSAKSVTIPAHTTEKTLSVQDNILGNKTYTISTTEAINIKILDNGRILIKGNGATIIANNGQEDDIIIQGHNNEISTKDGNDTVRVNTVRDSELGYSLPNSVILNNYSNNLINTGDGDDYVQNFGQNTINMAGGNDYIWDRQNYATITSAETSFTNIDNKVSDGEYGWFMQNGYGDCQFLSTLISLKESGKLNDYIQVSASNNGGWSVNFPEGVIKTVNVSPSDITAKSARGDKDIAIIEAALRTLIWNNNHVTMDDGTNADNILGNTTNFNLISKYIFGTTPGEIRAGADTFSTDKFEYMLNLYNNNEISNLVVGTKSQNTSIGIYDGHAYAVKNGVAGEYVNLINPHDSNDIINLEWNDFLKYFDTICLFGDTYDTYTEQYGKNVYYMSTITGAKNSVAFTSGTLGNYQYYINLYNAIKEAGGCELVPDDMLYSNKYLTNMVNNGFAYLKMIDNKTGEWVATSVATNTSLQEVADETELRKAEAKYEAEMRRIDMKDRKFDYDLAALENERNAIKNEVETLKTVAKDNVERTFKLFG